MGIFRFKMNCNKLSKFLFELSLKRKSHVSRSSVKIKSGAAGTIYDFLTSPSKTVEGYKYMPYNGAIFPLVIVNVSFALFAFRIGPWLMRNREPYNLRRILMAYNVSQIFFNGIMVLLSVYLLSVYTKLPHGLACIEHIQYDHPQKSFEIFCGYLYLFNKFLDYLETLFFVLRKSYKQITLLHVYHHIMMSSITYIYIRQEGTGGHITTVPMLNALVHTVMYVYYLMSSIHPEMKESLWWKKYITQIQLIQFIIDIIHQMWPLLFVPDCQASKMWICMASLQAAIMIFMFSKFYIKMYVQKPKRGKIAEKKL